MDPVVCDLSAIPADQRTAHIALARELFGDERNLRQLDDGIETVVPVDRLRDAAAFIDNERRCCRHLTFSLEVPSRGATLAMRVTGPGAADELRALVR